MEDIVKNYILPICKECGEEMELILVGMNEPMTLGFECPNCGHNFNIEC